MGDCVKTGGTTSATLAEITRDVRGWVKIILPKNMELSGKKRKVFFLKNGTIGSNNPHDDMVGSENNSSTNHTNNHGKMQNPFHIYLKDAFGSSTKRFIAVRIIIEDGADYKFSNLGSIIDGVTGAPPNSDMTCLAAGTPSPIIAKVDPPYPRQDTIFFIDTNVSATGDFLAGYNIVLQFSNSDETPVIIDPKIYNEG